MVRRPARLLLGIAFVASGIEGLRDRDRRARRAAAMGVGEAEAVARAVPGVQVGAGVLLALGRLPRLSSFALALTVIPEAATGHAFWSEEDKQERTTQRALFLRDLGLLGGLLVSAADTGGRESVPHRARRTAGHAVQETRTSAKHAAKQTRKTAQQAEKKAKALV